MPLLRWRWRWGLRRNWPYNSRSLRRRAAGRAARPASFAVLVAMLFSLHRRVDGRCRCRWHRCRWLRPRRWRRRRRIGWRVLYGRRLPLQSGWRRCRWLRLLLGRSYGWNGALCRARRGGPQSPAFALAEWLWRRDCGVWLYHRRRTLNGNWSQAWTPARSGRSTGSGWPSGPATTRSPRILAPHLHCIGHPLR